MAGKSIFGQTGRDHYMKAISQLDKNSLQLLDRYISRLNRKGAGLSYHLSDGPSPDVSVIRFRLGNNFSMSVEGTLKLGVVSVDREAYADADDFQVLINRVAHDLTTRSLYKDYKNSISQLSQNSSSMKP